MRITHIINDLDIGGAEIMLFRILEKLVEKNYQLRVISLSDQGNISEKIMELGIPTHDLGIKKWLTLPEKIIILWKLLKEEKQDIVQTWMYHSDLLGGAVSKIIGVPTIWSIHNNTIDKKFTKNSTRLAIHLCAKISKWGPNKILCCSNTSKEMHIDYGYESQKMVVIPNGIDTDLFKPNENHRISLQKELNVSEDARLIGFFARYDPQKDHQTFVKMASIIKRRIPNVFFVLCGNQIDWNNENLVNIISNERLQDCFHLLGIRNDIPRLTASLDLCVSSSTSEAFPLIIIEAMACGVPCVVTDVGDSGEIVGNSGDVVSTKNPEELANACEKILLLNQEDFKEKKILARDRIIEHFSLDKMVSQYEGLYYNVHDTHLSIC